MKKNRLLILLPYRENSSPGQRFSIEQYYDYLEANGFEIVRSVLIDNIEDEKIFYSKGHYAQKANIMLRSIRKRMADVKRAKDFDVVYIYNAAIMLGTTYFERKLKKTGVKMTVNCHDAIWLPATSEGNKGLSFLKNSKKVDTIFGLVDLVMAGNNHIAQYAGQFNKNVVVIPSTIDTDEYKPQPKERPADAPIVLGWSGSMTTIEHFKTAVPALRILKEKYGDRLQITVMGHGGYRDEQLGIQGLAWTKERELPTLCSFDLGIMPLPDDIWSRGKCGLKGLQYMALEIPTIMSPVGVNKDIIQDGVNGFLADTVDEWVAKASRLIDDAQLRRQMGQAGRQTVVDRYSVRSQRDVYLEHFRTLAEQRRRELAAAR